MGLTDEQLERLRGLNLSDRDVDIIIDQAKEANRLADDAVFYGYALSRGWSCRRVSCYDEEGVEGWEWENEHGTTMGVELGGWDEAPAWQEDWLAQACQSPQRSPMTKKEKALEVAGTVLDNGVFGIKGCRCDSCKQGIAELAAIIEPLLPDVEAVYRKCLEAIVRVHQDPDEAGLEMYQAIRQLAKEDGIEL